MYESVNAPVKKGDKLGEIVIKTNDGNVVKKNIVAENNVDKITFGKMYMKILKTWTT